MDLTLLSLGIQIFEFEFSPPPSLSLSLSLHVCMRSANIRTRGRRGAGGGGRGEGGDTFLVNDLWQLVLIAFGIISDSFSAVREPSFDIHVNIQVAVPE